MAYKLGQPTTLGSGPFTGVTNTLEPFDDDPNELTDAINCYIPDPVSGSGAYARPNCSVQGPLTGSDTGGGLYRHVVTDLTVYNFAFYNGKMYRFDSALANPVDVTPVAVTIATSSITQAFVFCASVGGQLVVTDGINRPWVGSSLSSTPVVGTYIDIDGLGGSWSTVGRPEVYAGAVFFITATVPTGSSVLPRLGIVWSEPNQPAVGYTQTNYTDFWNLLQTGTTPIYALVGTNTGLYYSRDLSWGVISGAPGSNFSTQATHDIVSVNVGCTQAATALLFGQYIYFADNVGRPWRFVLGGEPEAIWLKARSEYETQAAAGNAIPYYHYNWWAVVEPNLNLYILAAWYASPSGNPNQLSIYEARSGKYLGRWKVEPNGTASPAVPRALFCGGILQNASAVNQQYYLVMIGTGNPSGNGYVWTLKQIVDGVWADNGTSISASIQTQRMGFTPNIVWNADMGTVITMTQQPMTITAKTPYTSSTTELSAGTPNSSSDGIYRTPFGMDLCAAREIELTLTPTTTSAQWVVERVEVRAVGCAAGIEDQ